VCIIFLWFRKSKSNSSDPSQEGVIEDLKLENNSLRKDIENKDSLYHRRLIQSYFIIRKKFGI